jgi:hypothetical protein
MVKISDQNPLFDIPRPKRFQANVNIFAQKIADFRAIGLREQVGLQISRPDSVSVIEKGLSRGVEVRRRNPKRDREDKCQ